MNLRSRIKFVLGILVVFIIVGLLIVHLNNTMATVHAQKAELGADTTTVGIDYPGLITAQNVSVGDRVKKGQTLFVVTSAQLTANINNHSLEASSLPFDLDKSGNILVKASDNGVVDKIQYINGSYVPGGAIIATLDTASTLYISGHFHLSPPDYARLKKGDTMKVTFPDDSRVKATVESISLTQEGSLVDTIVKARLQDKAANDFHFPVGTPVEASVKLTGKTWPQTIGHFFDKLFKPKES